MDLDTIKLRLRSFIRDQFRVPETDSDFTDTVHLYDYGYVDSFGAMELRGFLESQFGVRLTPAELTSVPLNSVDQIAHFVVNRCKQGI